MRQTQRTTAGTQKNMLFSEKTLLCVFCLAFAMALQPTAALADEDPLLTTAKQNYAKLKDKDFSDWLTDRETIMNTYAANLDKAMALSQSKGNLDDLLALRSEKARFDRDKVLPEADSAPLPEAVSTLAKQAQQALSAADEKRKKNTVASATLYKQHLEKLKKEMTRSGDIASAMAVKTEIERIDALPEVLAASAEKKPAQEAALQTPAATPPPVVTPSTSAGTGPPCQDCFGTGKLHQKCPRCGGTGKCPACEGTGFSRMALSSSRCLTCQGSTLCKNCNGKKLVLASSRAPCSTCSGTGREAAPVTTIGNSSYPERPRYAPGSGSSISHPPSEAQLLEEKALAEALQTSTPLDVALSPALFSGVENVRGRILRSQVVLLGTREPSTVLLGSEVNGRPMTLPVQSYTPEVMEKAAKLYLASPRSNVIVIYAITKYGRRIIFAISPAE